MSRLQRLRILVVMVAVATLFSLARPAFALSYAGTTSFTCTSFNASGTGAAVLDRDNTGSTQEKFQIVVTDGYGVVLYSQTFQNGLGSYGGGLISTTAYTTAPTANPITMTATSLAGNTLPAIVEYVATGSCAGLPTASTSFSGPPIPAGFVLKTITCDVAVYDTPGGKPVGSNAIKGGQTWYVNPTPKNDPAGKSWTEIFVAGYINGYVPTSCVH